MNAPTTTLTVVREDQLKLGLWMSPAEFNAASQTFFSHPEWACTPIGTATSQIPDDARLGVWDFNHPAVRDYLGLAPTDVTDWQFVEVRDVPPGPWRSYGDNNHFVIARRQSEQRVAAGGSGAAKK